MPNVDELLAGGIDMHCHGYPEFSLEAPNRFSDAANIQAMRNAGLGGVVFKSHFWPTIGSAAVLDTLYDDFSVFGSVTLNQSAGDVSPWAVETASKLGARVVYMPTWSARNDLERGGISKYITRFVPSLARFPSKDAFYALDERGSLLPSVRDTMVFMKEAGMVLFTGHLSPLESLAMAKAAKDIGFAKLVFNHPDSNSIKAEFDQIKAMAELGAYIEICALGLTPLHYRITPQKFKDIIDAVGAERCIMTTDYFFEWSPPAPEQLRLLASCLLEVGVAEKAIVRMVRDNPRKLLGLE